MVYMGKQEETKPAGRITYNFMDARSHLVINRFYCQEERFDPIPSPYPYILSSPFHAREKKKAAEENLNCLSYD